MPKRRSLKDAAADPLVGKDRLRIAPAAAPADRPKRLPAGRRCVQPLAQEPAAPPAAPGPVISLAQQPQRSVLGPLARMAVSVLIGFIGGILFGRFIRIG